MSWKDFFAPPPPDYRLMGGPRKPSDIEVEDWFRAAQKQHPRRLKVGVTTHRQLVDYVRAKNPVRWRRLQKDYAWLERMVEKAGYDKEKARFLL